MARETGILTDKAIGELHAQGGIATARAFDEDHVQPASLDLRLGTVAYRIRASFLPGKENTVAEKVRLVSGGAVDLMVIGLKLVKGVVNQGDIGTGKKGQGNGCQDFKHHQVVEVAGKGQEEISNEK